MNFVESVYSPGYDAFARPVTFTLASGKTYDGRGIYDTRPLDVITEAGAAFSDAVTILDIIETEEDTLPPH